MEVSNLTVSIAPPIFSQGTEEAKKDSQSRESIPKPAPTSDAPKEKQTGSGSTTGTSSLLYTQSQSMVQNAGQQERENGKDPGKNKEKKTATIDASGKVSPKNVASSASSQIQNQLTNKSATFLPTPFSTLASSEDNRKNKELHARISSSIAQKLSKDSLQKLNAVAGRYNATGNRMLLGQNIDALI